MTGLDWVNITRDRTKWKALEEAYFERQDVQEQLFKVQINVNNYIIKVFKVNCKIVKNKLKLQQMKAYIFY